MFSASILLFDRDRKNEVCLMFQGTFDLSYDNRYLVSFVLRYVHADPRTSLRLPKAGFQ